MKIEFGNVGVCVGGYTKESLYTILAEHSLETLVDDHYVSDTTLIDKHTYLQAESLSPYREGNTLNVYGGYIHFVTDMENYLHILRVGILDPDAANSLVEELYLQGLIKPRNSYETN